MAVDKVISFNVWSVDCSGTIKEVAYDKSSNKGAVSLNKADVANDVASLKGTGLWTVLESVLTESKAQGAATATVDIYLGETKVNEESAQGSFNFAEEITSGSIASVIDGLGVKTIGDLEGKTVKITVNYGEFKLDYSVDFTTVEVPAE